MSPNLAQRAEIRQRLENDGKVRTITDTEVRYVELTENPIGDGTDEARLCWLRIQLEEFKKYDPLTSDGQKNIAKREKTRRVNARRGISMMYDGFFLKYDGKLARWGETLEMFDNMS